MSHLRFRSGTFLVAISHIWRHRHYKVGSFSWTVKFKDPTFPSFNAVQPDTVSCPKGLTGHTFAIIFLLLFAFPRPTCLPPASWALVNLFCKARIYSVSGGSALEVGSVIISRGACICCILCFIVLCLLCCIVMYRTWIWLNPIQTGLLWRSLDRGGASNAPLHFLKTRKGILWRETYTTN